MRPTAARLRELFDYDPITGVLRWRISTAIRVKAGDVAGSVRDGYRTVEIDNMQYRAHRVIWCMQTGAWPTVLIDHRDTNGLNNVWTNLREATFKQNAQNRRVQSNNALGLKGVRYQAGKFTAQIKGDGGMQMHLGSFNTAESATSAYARAAFSLYGEFARIA